MGVMHVSCEYPNCGEVATQLIVVERGYGSIERRVCSRHAERAQEIARREDGFAYHVYAT